MTLGKLICAFRGHRFPKWKRDKATGTYTRHCLRCPKVEADPSRTPYARKLKAATDADTVQPGAPHAEYGRLTDLAEGGKR